MKFPIALDGGRGSVNLPAAGFNQYNVPVLQTPGHHLRSDFARLVARKFGDAKIAIVGLTSAPHNGDGEPIICATVEELSHGSRFDGVIWFYPRTNAADAAEAAELARSAN